jgi:hypothetical protein
MGEKSRYGQFSLPVGLIEVVENYILTHPEEGVISVPDFIKQAINEKLSPPFTKEVRVRLKDEDLRFMRRAKKLIKERLLWKDKDEQSEIIKDILLKSTRKLEDETISLEGANIILMRLTEFADYELLELILENLEKVQIKIWKKL